MDDCGETAKLKTLAERIRASFEFCGDPWCEGRRTFVKAPIAWYVFLGFIRQDDIPHKEVIKREREYTGVWINTNMQPWAQFKLTKTFEGAL